ncbi:MAG: LptA/OstA family protein, partial [Bryocella sp.]
GVSLVGTRGATRTTQLTADELRAATRTTAQGQLQVERIDGSGHTKLVQRGSDGALQTSTGDTITAGFSQGREGMMELANAAQAGHVTVSSVPATKPGAVAVAPAEATAARASYDGGASRLTLAGGVHLQQGGFDLSASNVTMNQQTGDAEASGSVMATTLEQAKAPAPGHKAGAPQPVPQPAHVSANRATLLHGPQLAEFFGTLGHPARLWQGASEVQAASLLFDQKKKSIAARPESGGKVHAVFVRPTTGGGKTAQPPMALRVASSAMNYDDVHREATFSGGVRTQASSLETVSDRAVILLEPQQKGAAAAVRQPEFGGQLRQVVLLDNVRLSEPGRTGTGATLVYDAAEARYTLTGTPGHPPHVVDSKQGSITGATLVFHEEGTGPAGSTIIVNGADAGAKQGRVRTEVEVRGK